MGGNTHTYQSTSTNVNTDKDVLLYPPTQDQLTESTTQQLPIAPTKTTTSYMHMDVHHILVDSGPATRVCPKDYATQFPFWNLLKHLHHNSSQLQMIQSKSMALDASTTSLKDSQWLSPTLHVM